MLPDEYFTAKLLTALEDAHLEAIVVGSTAAILQGAPLMTLDIDLLIRDTPRNRKKLETVSAALDAPPPVPISGMTRALRILSKEVPVDLLLDSISGNLTFESVRSRAVDIEVGGKTARVASFEDVIRSKEAADRPKDRVHLLVLRDTLRVKKALEEIEASQKK